MCTYVPQYDTDAQLKRHWEDWTKMILRSETSLSAMYIRDIKAIAEEAKRRGLRLPAVV